MDALNSTGHVTHNGDPLDTGSLYDRIILGTRELDTVTTCSLGTAFVDVGMFCVRASADGETACAAKRAHHTPSLPMDTNDTILSQDGLTTVGYLPVWIPWFMPIEQSGVLTPLELYLADPAIGFQDYFAYWDRFNYTEISMTIFQARLALIFNTVVRLSLNTSVTLGSDGSDVDLARRRFNGVNVFANTSGTWVERKEPVYRISAWWITLYFVATSVLAGCAGVTVALRARIRAPEFVGSVAALTRDTPYVAGVPPGGSALNGTDLAKLLKDKWVRIQDVNPQGEVGKIAFSDDRRLAGEELNWSRRYKGGALLMASLHGC